MRFYWSLLYFNKNCFKKLNDNSCVKMCSCSLCKSCIYIAYILHYYYNFIQKNQIRFYFNEWKPVTVLTRSLLVTYSALSQINNVDVSEVQQIKKMLHLHLDSGLTLLAHLTAGAQQPAPVCMLRWHSDSEGSCNWGDKEWRASEVLTIPRQQGSISRETKGTQWFIQRREEGGGEGSEELSGKVILNFCPEMIFSHYVINIYLIPLLALLDLTV